MNATKNTTSATVIIPVYNASRFVQRCLDSVYAQTFKNFDIIVINDGSTDDSLALLQQNAQAHQKLIIIDQANHGQGYARNRALERARGKYLLFVDADDCVDETILEKTIAQAEKDHADVVHFSWQMRDGDTLKVFPDKHLTGKKQLSNQECEHFLEKNNYFCWDSLYRRDFINKHHIHFGEGYIYEDNEFIVQVASNATKISLLNEALYTMSYDSGSSTRSRYDTDRHSRDFLQAMQASFCVLQSRSPYSSFYLAGYFLEKFIVYYQRRVPRRYANAYLRGFIDILHAQKITVPVSNEYKFLRTCVRGAVFRDKRYQLFRAGILYKTMLLPILKRE